MRALVEGRRALGDAEGFVRVAGSPGQVDVTVGDVAWDGLQREAVRLVLSPAEARRVAQYLIEAADYAEGRTV